MSTFNIIDGNSRTSRCTISTEKTPSISAGSSAKLSRRRLQRQIVISPAAYLSVALKAAWNLSGEGAGVAVTVF